MSEEKNSEDEREYQRLMLEFAAEAEEIAKEKKDDAKDSSKNKTGDVETKKSDTPKPLNGTQTENINAGVGRGRGTGARGRGRGRGARNFACKDETKNLLETAESIKPIPATSSNSGDVPKSGIITVGNVSVKMIENPPPVQKQEETKPKITIKSLETLQKQTVEDVKDYSMSPKNSVSGMMMSSSPSGGDVLQVKPEIPKDNNIHHPQQSGSPGLAALQRMVEPNNPSLGGDRRPIIRPEVPPSAHSQNNPQNLSPGNAAPFPYGPRSTRGPIPRSIIRSALEGQIHRPFNMGARPPDPRGQPPLNPPPHSIPMTRPPYSQDPPHGAFPPGYPRHFNPTPTNYAGGPSSPNQGPPPPVAEEQPPAVLPPPKSQDSNISSSTEDKPTSEYSQQYYPPASSSYPPYNPPPPTQEHHPPPSDYQEPPPEPVSGKEEKEGEFSGLASYFASQHEGID